MQFRRSVITALFALALGAVAAFGQTTTREVVAFTGAAYNQNSTPRISWTLGGAVPVSDSAFVGIVADVAFSRTQQPGITVRPEYIREILSINGRKVYALAGIGATFQASDPTAVIQQLVPTIQAALANVGTNLGYSAASGLTTDIDIGRGWHLLPAARVVKGSLNDTQVVIGFNIGRKMQISRK